VILDNLPAHQSTAARFCAKPPRAPWTTYGAIGNAIDTFKPAQLAPPLAAVHPERNLL
jgi:hypothetical protein